MQNWCGPFKERLEQSRELEPTGLRQLPLAAYRQGLRSSRWAAGSTTDVQPEG
jgi:hypothetical protein